MREMAISIIKSAEINLAIQLQQNHQRTEPPTGNDCPPATETNIPAEPGQESPHTKKKGLAKKKMGLSPRILPGSCSKKRNASLLNSQTAARRQRSSPQRNVVTNTISETDVNNNQTPQAGHHISFDHS